MRTIAHRIQAILSARALPGWVQDGYQKGRDGADQTGGDGSQNKDIARNLAAMNPRTTTDARVRLCIGGG